MGHGIISLSFPTLNGGLLRILVKQIAYLIHLRLPLKSGYFYTGRGRVYSIRYRYIAFFYVYQLLNEIRLTNVTQGNIRKPERMAYHALLIREYVFHKKTDTTPIQSPNNTNIIGQSVPTTANSSAGYNNKAIKVNMDDFE